MGKKRKSKATPVDLAEKAETMIDGAMASLYDSAQKKAMKGGSLTPAQDRDLVGLPMPSLLLRYLFGSTIFPLSRIVQIVGPWGSCKSSLLYEIFRWFVFYGGGVIFAENESKDAEELRNGILQHNQKWIDRIHKYPTTSVQEWQKVIWDNMENLKKMMNDKLGRTFPMLFALDSVAGSESQDIIDKIADQGYATRQFSSRALFISQYMGAMPQALTGKGTEQPYPFTVVGTNHQKTSTDPNTFLEVKRTVGGDAIKFHETYQIEMTKRGRSGVIDLTEYSGIKNVGGHKLRMVMQKSSAGPDGRWGDANFVWYWQRMSADTDPVQHFFWDWGTADINFLLSFDTDQRKGKKSLYKELREIVDINVVSRKQGGTCTSKVLGIPKNAPVTWRQAGAMLNERYDLLHQLYPLLGITERFTFTPGLDYAKQVAEATAYADAQTKEAIGDPENLPPAGEAETANGSS